MAEVYRQRNSNQAGRWSCHRVGRRRTPAADIPAARRCPEPEGASARGELQQQHTAIAESGKLFHGAGELVDGAKLVDGATRVAVAKRITRAAFCLAFGIVGRIERKSIVDERIERKLQQRELTERKLLE